MLYSSCTRIPVLRTRHQDREIFQVTNSNDGECFSTPHRRLKTPQFCAKIFYTSNTQQTRAVTGLSTYFASASYPLSINTRITRENRTKNNHNSEPPKQAPPNGLPQPFPHARSPEQGIKTKPCLTGGWPHFVKPSTPHKFFNRWCRQSLNRNPKGDPHDLAFDEINSRRGHHAFNGL